MGLSLSTMLTIILLSLICCKGIMACPLIDLKSAELLVNFPFFLQEPVLVSTMQSRFCWISSVKQHLKTRYNPSISKLEPLLKLPEEIRPFTVILSAETEDALRETMNLVSMEKLGRRGQVLILVNGNVTEGQMMEINVELGIDQNVYVINLNAKSLFEAYKINNHTMWNRIGSYRQNFENSTKLTFEYNDKWSPNLRDNFFESHLVVMVEHSPPYLTLNPNFKNFADFFDTNQTYDVTNFIYGLYPDILEELSMELNFTYRVYKRADGVWGTLVDGKPAGILKNLADSSADLIAADYGMNRMRLPYCKHLPIITSWIPAIVIKKDLNEHFSIETYIHPYHWTLWLSMFVSGMTLAGWLYLGNHAGSNHKVVEKLLYMLGWIWTTFAYIVGDPPMKRELSKDTNPNRIVFGICLISGVILWLSYQATLTSELATLKASLPITNMETLVKSDFEVGTFVSGSAQADAFRLARSGTVHHDLYKTKLQTQDSNVTFVSNEGGLQLVMEKDRYAFINPHALILAAQDILGLDCKVVTAWKARIPTMHASFATPKNSPFNGALSRALFKVISSGRLNALEKKWLRSEPNCEPVVKEYARMTLKKLIAPFLVVAFGTMLAFGVLAFENIVVNQIKWTGEVSSFEEDPKVLQAFALIQRKLDLWSNVRMKTQYKKMPFRSVVALLTAKIENIKNA